MVHSFLTTFKTQTLLLILSIFMKGHVLKNGTSSDQYLTNNATDLNRISGHILSSDPFKYLNRNTDILPPDSYYYGCEING